MFFKRNNIMTTIIVISILSLDLIRVFGQASAGNKTILITTLV